MRRPSFQFYPGDWTSNPNLKRCTFAEKGIWLEVMCLMHDQAEYGVLRWPLKEIAEAVKCKPADIQALVRKGVLKGSDKEIDAFIYVPRSGRKDGDPVTLISEQGGPLWYSSRMVKDEYVRTHRGESSRFGADNGASPKSPPKTAPKPPIGDGSSSSSSSSSSSPTVSVSRTRKAKPTKVPIPDDFGLTPEREAYAAKHLPEVDASALMDVFRSNAKAKGWEYVDWDQHWQTLVRQWAPNSGHWSSEKYPRIEHVNGAAMRYADGREVRW